MLGLILAGPAAGAPFNQPPQKLTAEQQERLRQRDNLDKDALKLLAKGDLAVAIATYEKILTIEREVLGPSDSAAFFSMRSLATLAALSGDFATARRWAAEALAIQTKATDHAPWQLRAARRTCDEVEQLAGMAPERRARLREAEQLNAQAMRLAGDNDFKAALAPALQALEIRKAELNPEHPDFLTSLSIAGWVYRELNDNDHAEPLLRTCLATREKVLGDDHPDFANGNNVLAWLAFNKGDYPQAETLFRRAAEAYRRGLGPWSRSYAQTLNNLAEFYVRTKAYRRAEALRLQVLDVCKTVQGVQHNEYAKALVGLSIVYQYLGEYDKAEPLSVQALEIFRQNLGPKDAETINAMREVAYIYRKTGQADKSLPLELEALDLRKQQLGPDHSEIGAGLTAVSSIYSSLKDYGRALEFSRQAAEVFRKSLGENSDQYRSGLSNVNLVLETLASEAQLHDDFPAAHRAREEQLEILGKLYGPQNWRLTNTRLTLAYVDDLAKMTPDQRRELKEADELANKANASSGSKPLEALAQAEKALEIRRRLLGDEHAFVIESLKQLGYLYKESGDYAKAKPIRMQLPDLCRKIKGEQHPDYANSLHNLASLYESLGDYPKAISLYEQAAVAWKNAYGPKNAMLANTLNSLAEDHQVMGDYRTAETLFRQSVEMSREVLGPNDLRYAHSLLNLGGFYMWSLSDDAKAEPLLEQAVAIYKVAVGEKHPDYARGIDYLASLYVRSGKYDRAEPLYRQALAIRQQALGEKHVDCAVSLHNLALLYLIKQDYARAEPLYLQALAIDEAILGKDHYKLIPSLRQLAEVYRDSGRLAESESTLQRAVDICRQTLDKENPEYAESLSDLAVVYALGDKPTRGVAPALEALRLGKTQLDRSSEFLSERRQLGLRQKVWSVMNAYLFVTARAGVPAEDVYPHVLNWKGVVGAGQQQLRALYHRLAKSGNRQVADLAVELERATQSLAEQSRAREDSDRERRFRLEELSDKIEQLQQKLASASVEFRQKRDQSRRTVDDIRKVLPENAVLVDFLSCDHPFAASDGGKPAAHQASIVGFVVRAGRPVARVEFGSTELISQSIENWRKHYGAKTASFDPGAQLRGLLWKPLESHVRGAGILLISPESTLAPLPWAAIPGAKPGTYLIDELGIAVVPVVRLLPELLADDPADAKIAQQPSLLVIGDVDFGAQPGKLDLASNSRGAVRSSQAFEWAALPGTRDEIAAVRTSFGQRFAQGDIIELAHDRATKTAVRGQVGQHEYLHFSTHGFFAPPDVPSAIADASPDKTTGGTAGSSQNMSGYHPGLLSGLVLAGANRPPEDGRDDGILTALEVAELDLSRVRLATLSACETGLGKSAGGEGLLGLQRAFQMAGAHSVLAGLWKVPDRATQALMSRFYANLWQKKMSRLEALREAQQWMIHEGSKIPGGLRGLDTSADDQQPLASSDRLPPFYWAAFVLSGDWR
jgi:CHAT domain-containing protein/Tfp pilus assembly protein PilF